MLNPSSRRSFFFRSTIPGPFKENSAEEAGLLWISSSRIEAPELLFSGAVEPQC